MASRYDEAQPASESGLFSRRDLFNLDAVSLDPAREGAEVGFRRNLEASIVHSRCLRLAQDDAVSVELVPGSQIDAAIGLTADLVQSNAIHIMAERIQLGYPDLNVAGPQHTFQRHSSLLFGLGEPR